MLRLSGSYTKYLLDFEKEMFGFRCCTLPHLPDYTLPRADCKHSAPTTPLPYPYARSPTLPHTVQPAAQPAMQSSAQPAMQPSAQHPMQPAMQPAMQPSAQHSMQPSAQPAWQSGSGATKRYGYSLTPPPSLTPLPGNYPYPYYPMPGNASIPLIPNTMSPMPSMSPMPQQMSPMPPMSPMPGSYQPMSPMPQQMSPMPGNYPQMPYDMRGYAMGAGYASNANSTNGANSVGNGDGSKRFCPTGGASGPAEQEAPSQDEGLRVLLNFRRSVSPVPSGGESGWGWSEGVTRRKWESLMTSASQNANKPINEMHI